MHFTGTKSEDFSETSHTDLSKDGSRRLHANHECQGCRIDHPKNQVSMIRKHHNHTLQTNPRHREEKPQNTDCQETSGRQLM